MNFFSQKNQISEDDYKGLIKYLTQIEEKLEILKKENLKLEEANKKLRKKNYLQKQFSKSVLNEKKKGDNHKQILNSHLYLLNDKLEKLLKQDKIQQTLVNFDQFWKNILAKNEEILNLTIQTDFQQKESPEGVCKNCLIYKNSLEKYEFEINNEFQNLQFSVKKLAEENRNWQIKYSNLEKSFSKEEFSEKNKINSSDVLEKKAKIDLKTINKRLDLLKMKSEHELKKSISKSQEIKRKQKINLNFKNEEEELENLSKLINN